MSRSMRQFGDIFQRTILGAIFITLALGLVGGFCISRNFLRRVDAITDASRSIMAGRSRRTHAGVRHRR